MFHKKPILTFLLLLVALVVVLSGNLLQLQQLSAQWNMKKLLTEKQLITLNNLLPSQFTWIETGREMLINETLFDVEEFTINNDGSINVKGLFDEKEQLVLNKLRGHQDENNNSAINNILEQFFCTILAMPPQTLQISKPLLKNIKKKYTCNSAMFIWVTQEILTPPPKV